MNSYRNYKSKVYKISNKQRLHTLPNYELRGKGSYHLDHIYSIKQGYINNIDPEIIGDIKNLRFIPYKQNLQKSCKINNEAWDMFQYFINEEII